MTFEQWWESEGCRKECLTHRERARQAWMACSAGIWDRFVADAGKIVEKAYDTD